MSTGGFVSFRLRWSLRHTSQLRYQNVTIYKMSQRTHHIQAPSELRALSKPAAHLHNDRGMSNVTFTCWAWQRRNLHWEDKLSKWHSHDASTTTIILVKSQTHRYACHMNASETPQQQVNTLFWERSLGCHVSFLIGLSHQFLSKLPRRPIVNMLHT